jgi:hypothetical protein
MILFINKGNSDTAVEMKAFNKFDFIGRKYINTHRNIIFMS